MVSYIPDLLDETLVFGADLIINSLEVDLVDPCSEAVCDGVLGCSSIIVLIGLEKGDKDGFGVLMVGDQYVLITAARSDGEASSVIYVDLRYWLGPNMYLI